MVFSDLTSVPIKRQVASVPDRVISVVLDFAIFSPFFSLLMSGPIGKLQYRYYAASSSTEFWILFGLVAFCYFVMSVVVQGISWAAFGATPGQYFLQLRVVTAQTNRFPSLGMAWLRALLFCFECVLCGIPLLEVYSRSDRRSLHDRASDTEVITLKGIGTAAPTAIEVRSIKFVMSLFFASLTIWSSVMLAGLYRKTLHGAFELGHRSEDGELCAAVPETTASARVDVALSMFEAGVLSSECLESETDLAFWNGSSEDQAWASLASAFLNKSDKTLSKSYLDQSCNFSPKGVACSIASWWKDGADGEIAGAANSWTRSVLSIRNFERKRRIAEWQTELENTPADFNIDEFIEVEKVKLLWAQRKQEQARGAYEVIFNHLSQRQAKEISSDLCFSEMTLNCTNQTYKFCRNLETALRKSPEEDVEPKWLLALAEEKSCRRASRPNLLEFARDIDPDGDWGQLILALVPESEWEADKRQNELRRIVKSSDADSLVRERALVELLRKSSRVDDLELSQSLLTEIGIPASSEVQALVLQTSERLGLRIAEPETSARIERDPASEKSAGVAK